MEHTDRSVFVILGLAVTAVLLSWLYFRRYRVTRPPIGVFNLRDIAAMIAGILLVPYLFLMLPNWLVAALLTVSTLSVLYFLWEPVLRSRWLVWLASLALVAADIWAALRFGTVSRPYFIVNDGVLLLMVVGLTNLWAQSGMKARDAALLGAFLTVYDLTATWFLPLMTEMITRLVVLPFSPMLAWPLSDAGQWVGIGLGDLLLAAVFPLVMRKAFGWAAGVSAMLVAIAAIAAILLVPLGVIFPVMIVLGPLMVLQYLYWRRQGHERTTWQYLQAEPLSAAWPTRESSRQMLSGHRQGLTTDDSLATTTLPSRR